MFLFFSKRHKAQSKRKGLKGPVFVVWCIYLFPSTVDSREVAGWVKSPLSQNSIPIAPGLPSSYFLGPKSSWVMSPKKFWGIPETKGNPKP